MNIKRYVDSRIRYFIDKQTEEQATKKAKDNLKKASKELEKIKNPKKKPFIKKILFAIKGIMSNPFVQAGALLGVASLVHRVARWAETRPDAVERRRLARMEENRRNLNAPAPQPAQEAAAATTAENLIKAAQKAAEEAEAARTRSVVSEMDAPGKQSPWKSVQPSWSSGSGFKVPNLASGKNVKVSGNPSRASFGQALLNKIQNHASVSEIKGMKEFTHGSNGSHKVSFGQDLLNKIQGHASSKIFKVKGKSSKFGEKFFEGGYGNDTRNTSLPGVSSYKGPTNARYGGLDFDPVKPPEKKDAGYLVRKYKSRLDASNADALAKTAKQKLEKAKQELDKIQDPEKKLSLIEKVKQLFSRIKNSPRTKIILSGIVSYFIGSAIASYKASKKAEYAKNEHEAEMKYQKSVFEGKLNNDKIEISGLKDKIIQLNKELNDIEGHYDKLSEAYYHTIGENTKLHNRKLELLELINELKRKSTEANGLSKYIQQAEEEIQKRNEEKVRAVAQDTQLESKVLGLAKSAAQDMQSASDQSEMSKDAGYLVRTYDSMPWAYSDAMERKMKRKYRKQMLMHW